MSLDVFPDESRQDAERVRAFFDRWRLYRKVLTLDYLSHREAYAALGAALKSVRAPFSFLDLGAGDADCTTAMLRELPVASYEAVDLSGVALGLAEENAGRLSCPKRFTQADFAEYIAGDSCGTFDVIFIGLSLHHLPAADKAAFLPKLRSKLAEGGSFFFYEPIRNATESRADVMSRWWTHAQAAWIGLDSAELEEVREHIFEHDYPESLDAYETMARAGGFRDFEVLYVSPGDFYALVRAST